MKTVPKKPGDSKAATPIQLPNVPEGGTTGGPGGKGEGIVTKIKAGKITLKNDAGQETTLDVPDTRGIKVGQRVRIQQGKDKVMVTPIQLP
jgi:hypothetical protein